jgi:hypothetical protein
MSHTAIPAKVTKADLTSLSNIVIANKQTQDTFLASAIAEWSDKRTYQQNNICIRNKAFYISNITNNLNNDPMSDIGGAWGSFVPNEVNSLFFNRAPTNGDVFPVSVKWYDTSFGSDTPLVSMSLGNGAWACLNPITLKKVRISAYGSANTYKASVNGTRFFRPDGTRIPNNWFVWGATSGIGAGTKGTTFNSAQINAAYNSSGWTDIELTNLFDTNSTIGYVEGDFGYSGYMHLSQIDFYYSNGARKVFSGTGASSGSAVKLFDCTPNALSKYGESTSAPQGEALTAVKLSDINDTTYGNISGSIFNQAFALDFANMIKVYDDRIAAIEAKVPLP